MSRSLRPLSAFLVPLLGVLFVASWAGRAEASSCSMDGPGSDVTFVGTAVAVTDRPDWADWADRPGGTRARFAVEEVWREMPGRPLDDRVELRAGGPELKDGYRPASWAPPLYEPGERYRVDAVVAGDGNLVVEHCRGGAQRWNDGFAAQRPAEVRVIEQPDQIATEPWSSGPPWRVIAIVAGLVVALALARLVWVGERSGYEPTARNGSSQA